MMGVPLIRHSGPDRVFAYRDGTPVTVAQFLGDVAWLAESLPARQHVLNLCGDRYRFAVAFSAALLRGQISLLPPNYTPKLVERLQRAYPELYCLADGEVDLPGIDIVRFSQQAHDAVCRTIPSIPERQCAALVFTSGSTGDPVAHPKTWGSLCKGARAAAAGLGIAPDSGIAVLGTVPAQHMYGLEACMLMPMQNGLALVAERPFYPADIAERLHGLPPPRCLVTTPVHLRTLLAGAGELPEVGFVLCATAPLPSALAAEAEARYAAPLHEIYGSTETGMVAGRRTTEGDSWRLLPGISMISDEAGCRVFGGHVEIEARLSDVVLPGESGTFRLLGREADMVNIAGKRASLAGLNHLLNEIPGVVDGAFFMPDDSDDGMKRPMAFVAAPGLESKDILGALRASIDSVFLPRPLYFVDALPRNATGKLTREALIRLWQDCTRG